MTSFPYFRLAHHSVPRYALTPATNRYTMAGGSMRWKKIANTTTPSMAETVCTKMSMSGVYHNG
jgi:hypothetical protein